MLRHPLSMSAASFATVLWIAGCGSSAPPASAPSEMPPATVDAHDDHDHEGHDHGEHDHPSEGPHHGDLVELGGEEYHAEVVHGEGGAITVYILDGTAKVAAPVDATEVTFNVVHDGQPEQFKLPASPDAGDPAGQSSRFTRTDEELAKHLDEEGTKAKLMLTISGKSYSGEVEHHHEHEDGHKH